MRRALKDIDKKMNVIRENITRNRKEAEDVLGRMCDTLFVTTEDGEVVTSADVKGMTDEDLYALVEEFKERARKDSR